MNRSVSIVAAQLLIAVCLGVPFLLHAVTTSYIYDESEQLVRAIDSEGNVITYEYDFGGNLEAVIRSTTADLAAPVVDSLPVTLNADETFDLRIEGSNLLLAELLISDPDIVATRYRANDTFVMISLEIPVDATIGIIQLSFTTALGAATYEISILGPRPVVLAAYPRSGPSSGGTSVRLSGKHFTASTVVQFGGQSIASQFVDSSTMLVSAPSGIPGASVSIIADNSNGTATLEGGFFYSFPFSVPGALGLTTESPTTGSLRIHLAEPALEATTLIISADDPSIVVMQESVTFQPGESVLTIPAAGLSIGNTRVVTALGNASLSTAVFVSEPYLGPVEVYARSVGQVVIGSARSQALGLVCVPQRLPNIVLGNGQTRSFDYPLPFAAGPGGLTLTLLSENPQTVTVADQVVVPDGSASVSFSLDGGNSGVTQVSIVGEGVSLLFRVHVNVAVEEDGPYLAAPVGVYTAPVAGTLAAPTGVYAAPVAGTLAPPVGADVQSN